MVESNIRVLLSRQGDYDMKPQPKPKPVRSRDYLEFIRGFACLVCGNTPVESCHTGPHGLGTKSDDFRSVPLCADHHRGPTGLDRLGPASFERLYAIDIKEQVIRHMKLFMEHHGILY